MPLAKLLYLIDCGPTTKYAVDDFASVQGGGGEFYEDSQR